MYWTQGLHRSVQQSPEAPATIFGDRVRTFREQADRVSRLAGALRELGVRDGARVGILALNSDRFAELLLAIPWADGTFNAIDVMRGPSEVAPMLAESQTSVLFVDDAFTSAVAAVRKEFPGLQTVVHMGEEATPHRMSGYEDLIATATPIEDPRRRGDTMAGLLHTGGTTGSPKAVMLSHAELVTAALGIGATVPSLAGAGTRFLQVTPMSHMSGIIGFLMQTVFGGTFVPVPRFDPAAVLASIERHRATGMFVVPPMLQTVVDHPDAVRRDLSSVRTVLYGASPMTESVLKRAMAAFTRGSFAQVYATTESVAGTFLTPDDHADGTRLRSAGRAGPHSEVRVVDTEDNDVPRGSLGEVLLRGDGTMLGYWNDPDATTEAMRGGWMHTGDIGYLDDAGYLFVVDRLKDMVIVDGDNVHSAEVENTIADHPDVAACAVIGVPDGETGERVHAVVVRRQGASCEGVELGEHCAARIAPYKVPTSWEFVDSLPLSPAGKVLKRVLRERHWAGRARQVN